LNREQKKNALSRVFWSMLYDLVTVVQNTPRTEVLIVRGKGNAFTSGSDIDEFSRISAQEVDETFVMMEKAIAAVERLPIPTIASVSGIAMGAGFELALACDLRIGCEKTRMGMPVGRLGITLRHQFAERLVNVLGPSRTKDLVYTGRSYSGQEAYELGLLNYLVADAELNNATIALAGLIQSQSSASLRAIKQSVADCMRKAEPSGSKRQFPYYVDSLDFAEGVSAFIEKRKPEFIRIDRRNEV